MTATPIPVRNDHFSAHAMNKVAAASPHPITAAVCAVLLSGIGCGSSESPQITDSCVGVVDTESLEEAVLHNTGDPLWRPETEWEIVEEMRFSGGEDSTFFVSIVSIDVDQQGHLYVLDSYTQQISVFDPEGIFLRTVGSSGSGPGEFENATAVDISDRGEIWVMEMQLGKLTILDAEGNYLRTERVNTTGWDFRPYPGGFDPVGRYNAMSLCYDYEEEKTKTMLARFDQSFTPIDTIAIPRSPYEIDHFEYNDSDGGSYSTLVPFQGTFHWVFSNTGNLWTLYTGTYELVEITAGGIPIRRVTKEHEPVPVTRADRESVRDRLEWFTEIGGTIDEARIPRNKPGIETFFTDDEGNLWVMHAGTENLASVFDIFDARGQFLGETHLPFSLDIHSGAVVQDGLLFGVTEDEEGGAMVVRARIKK